MSPLSFRESLLSARSNKSPILAFNVLDFASLLGVLEASVLADVAVICQYSARTVSFYGAAELAQLTRMAAQRIGARAFTHLDHCIDSSILESCIDARFDGVMFDGSSLSLDENIKQTQHWRRETARHGIVLEAEFSAIAGEEDGHAGAATSEALDEAGFANYVSAVGADIVGADIGTHHGHYAGGEPDLDYQLVRRLASNPTSPFVIHGGSGLSSPALTQLAECGVAKLNISTDLKDAWRSGMHATPAAEPLLSIGATRERVRALCTSKWDSILRRRN